MKLQYFFYFFKTYPNLLALATAQTTFLGLVAYRRKSWDKSTGQPPSWMASKGNQTAGSQRWGFRDGPKNISKSFNIRTSKKHRSLISCRNQFFAGSFTLWNFQTVAISQFSKDILREKPRTWEVIRTSKLQRVRSGTLDMSGAKRSNRWSLLPCLYHIDYWPSKTPAIWGSMTIR